jgi:hypothetical protein
LLLFYRLNHGVEPGSVLFAIAASQFTKQKGTFTAKLCIIETKVFRLRCLAGLSGRVAGIVPNQKEAVYGDHTVNRSL